MNRQRPSHYIHGSSSEEQRRLSTLNELINHSSFEQMNPRRGEKVLDVGSGLGQFARMIARATGERVIGVERDRDQIEECRRLGKTYGEEDLLEIRPGDVYSLPLSVDEWGTFDLAHARFVLEHLDDPAVAVRGMVRAVRPGGRVVLEDDDHDLLRLWPECSGADELWRAYCSSQLALGNDPWIGRKLTALLHAAGAAPSRATWVFFGASAGEPTFPVYVDNLIGLLRGARAHIVDQGLIDEGLFEGGLQSLVEWKKRPEATFWYARAWAEGRVEG
ncbi:MAG: methyltransferase domain-containing protein [Ignavibacteria bacterium]|nr:methyltransferase domain-containing protein [Ignavibacteria bacterium]